MSSMWFADVIVDISIDKLDKTFQYILPDDMISQVEIGSPVIVPFGNRKIKGYVIDITDTPKLSVEKLKPIASIVIGGVNIENRMIKLAAWLKKNYGSTMNQALKTVLPVKETVKRRTQTFISLSDEYSDDDGFRTLAESLSAKRCAAQLRLLVALKESGELDADLVKDKLSVSTSTINTLKTKGFITTSTNPVYRNPLRRSYSHEDGIELNPAQKMVSDAIIGDYDRGIRNTYLIKGVTGSGKTEVYMEIIEHVIGLGKQVIMMIPEIALTYQTVMRFKKRFGQGVSILNSRMSKGERYDQYLMASRGEVNIMIGPRSVLFTPFENLGLIIIDEEHEPAYKSEISPKYHAREAAVYLAGLVGASVVLGSATPSVDAYYKALSGEYMLYELKERAGSGTLPSVETVDLREELRSGWKSMISRRLKELMEDRLRKKEQIMIFLNRRGYVGFVNCRECGEVIKCPHCDVALTIHNNGRMMCHYCGYTTPTYKNCPKCGSKYIGGFKVGTEKVEQTIKEMFPLARVLRMDLDTTRGKEGHEKILEEFSSGNADILVGTQMIVKGHDFPNVTLMGILLADLSLYSGDFRAPERTFQLLTQAAGRAGRGVSPGNVVIQTYDPEHYSIKAALKHDYEEFYSKEIMYRELMGYPPASQMMSVKFSSSDEELIHRAALDVKNVVMKHVGEIERLYGGFSAVGPTKAAVYKINDIFSVYLYFKQKRYTALTYIKDIMEKYINEMPEYSAVNIQFDMNQ